VTSVKILQYIGDCLCDICKDLAIHRWLSLWRLLRSCNTSSLAQHSHWLTCGNCLCDLYKDLAIQRRLSFWRLLWSCNTSAIVFVTSVQTLQYVGDCLCDICKDLAIRRRLSLWRLLGTCKTSAIASGRQSSIYKAASLVHWWWCLCNFW